jgi:hypothetical protein
MNTFASILTKSIRTLFAAAVLIALNSTLCSAQGMKLGVQPKSFLVLSPPVQKEIKLTETQIKKIESIFGETVSTDDQGRTRIQLTGGEDMDQMNLDVLKVLDVAQLKRLTEIWIQRVGPSALGTKEIQKLLALNAKQIEKITAEMERFQEEMHGLISDNGGQLTPEIMKPAQDKLKSNLKAILTKEQSDKFDAMKGLEFKMKP